MKDFASKVLEAQRVIKEERGEIHNTSNDFSFTKEYREFKGRRRQQPRYTFKQLVAMTKK